MIFLTFIDCELVFPTCASCFVGIVQFAPLTFIGKPRRPPCFFGVAVTGTVGVPKFLHRHLSTPRFLYKVGLLLSIFQVYMYKVITSIYKWNSIYGQLGLNFTLLIGCYFNFNYNHRLFWAHLDISSGNPERPFNVTHRRCHLLTPWSFGSLEKQGLLSCGCHVEKKQKERPAKRNEEMTWRYSFP